MASGMIDRALESHRSLISFAAYMDQPQEAFRLALFQGAFGPTAPPEEVHRRIISWTKAAAPNTLRALASDLRIVDLFQQTRNRPALPITPADLYLLIHERAAAGAAKSSIDRLVASMVRVHALAGLPSPVDDNVRWKQKEIRKADGRERRQAKGLRLKGEAVNVIEDEAHPLSLLKLLESIPDDPAGLRDKALISTAYDAGLRRSEAVRICVHHIERLSSGEASLFIPRSKTDQEGEGARTWLSQRSVVHLYAWMTLAGLESGYIFRPLSYRTSAAGHLSEGAVSKILKARMKAFLQPMLEANTITQSEAEALIASISSHSLRVGCDQDLFAAGVDIGAIMQGLRWSGPKQPLSYARHLAPATSKLAAVMRSIK